MEMKEQAAWKSPIFRYQHIQHIADTKIIVIVNLEILSVMQNNAFISYHTLQEIMGTFENTLSGALMP